MSPFLSLQWFLEKDYMISSFSTSLFAICVCMRMRDHTPFAHAIAQHNFLLVWRSFPSFHVRSPRLLSESSFSICPNGHPWKTAICFIRIKSSGPDWACIDFHSERTPKGQPPRYSLYLPAVHSPTALCHYQILCSIQQPHRHTCYVTPTKNRLNSTEPY